MHTFNCCFSHESGWILVSHVIPSATDETMFDQMADFEYLLETKGFWDLVDICTFTVHLLFLWVYTPQSTQALQESINTETSNY